MIQNIYTYAYITVREINYKELKFFLWMLGKTKILSTFMDSNCGVISPTYPFPGAKSDVIYVNLFFMNLYIS